MTSKNRAGRSTAISAALSAAAVSLAIAEERTAAQAMIRRAALGKLSVPEGTLRPRVLTLRSVDIRVSPLLVSPSEALVATYGRNGSVVSIRRDDQDDHRFPLSSGHGSVWATTTPTADGLCVRLSDEPHTFEVTEPAHTSVAAEVPGLVIRIDAEPGDRVKAGDRLLVLETMKLEYDVVSPLDGYVSDIDVHVGSLVEIQTPLLSIRSAPAPAPLPSADADRRPEADIDRLLARRTAGAWMLSALLGYDLPANIEDLIDLYLAERGLGRITLIEEIQLVQAFLDLIELFSDRPVVRLPSLDCPSHTPAGCFFDYVNAVAHGAVPTLSPAFAELLTRALGHYGVSSWEPAPELESALFRLQRARSGLSKLSDFVTRLIRFWTRAEEAESHGLLRPILGRLVRSSRGRSHLNQAAVDAWDEDFGSPEAWLDAQQRSRETLARLSSGARAAAIGSSLSAVSARDALVRALLRSEPCPVTGELLDNYVAQQHRILVAGVGYQPLIDADAPSVDCFTAQGGPIVIFVPAAELDSERSQDWAEACHRLISRFESCSVEIFLRGHCSPTDEGIQRLAQALLELEPEEVRRATLIACSAEDGALPFYISLERESGEGLRVLPLHPREFEELGLSRFDDFVLTRVPYLGHTVLLRAQGRQDPKDVRPVACDQVIPSVAGPGRVATDVRKALAEASLAIRWFIRREVGERVTGHAVVHVVSDCVPVELQNVLQDPAIWGPLDDLTFIDASVCASSLATAPPAHPTGPYEICRYRSAIGLTLEPDLEQVLQSSKEISASAARASGRGLAHPTALIPMVAGRGGEFEELDLNERGELVAVDRPAGQHQAGIVVGVATSQSLARPSGIRRIVLFSDPLKSLGALAQAECDRIIAALDRARTLGVPVDWYAVSAGARISTDSGTENMDAVAAVLREIVLFTQAGGELNLLLCGITVGAQPYWSAEATMLMHTRGILVMTPQSSMVLTGKQSLEFSGSVSAESNTAIGGYDRVMGGNGQGQYWAPSIAEAHRLLMRFHELTYLPQQDTALPRLATTDPPERDITESVHAGSGRDFSTIGDIFTSPSNAGRKRAFSMRSLIETLSDADRLGLERWSAVRGGSGVLVVDTTLGGFPVCFLGIESEPQQRLGLVPSDGPSILSGSTLFPAGSKKAARALNAASGNRPVIVLANLAGFDGSPESLRRLQLEYGAEIGRAVVNFVGPILFVVVGRYHGGAFVVFSKALNPNVRVIAIDGSYASVIGGAPAAAVVFSRKVEQMIAESDEVAAAQAELESGATPAERRRCRAALNRARELARAEAIFRLGSEFEEIHNVDRAVRLGSIDEVIEPSRLRPRLIECLESLVGERQGL